MGELLHKSYYTITVKLQAEDDKHMLIHGYTGAIDIVDSNIVNALMQRIFRPYYQSTKYRYCLSVAI